VLAADGSDLLTTRAFPTPPPSFADRDYFLAQKESDAGLFLSGSYLGKITNAPIFNFSIRRSSGDGRFNGVIGSSAFVDYFQNYYATVGDVDDDFAVSLLRNDGEVLARYPEFKVGQKLDLTELRPHAGAGHQVRYMPSPIDHLDRLYASATIGNFPAYISFSIARGAIIRQWAQDLAIPAGVTVVITAALLMLTVFAFRRAQRESFAIQQLKDVAQSLNEEIQRRKKAEVSLLQAQKLDALGRITSGIAHDFNNLLMIISGSLSLAKKQEAGPVMRRLLNACEQATERGAALIRQLLAFSRGQTLRPVAIDVRRVLEDGQAWIGRIVTEAVQIDIACDDAVWPIFVDSSQFESALLNLVVNARDAMPNGGRLAIRVQNVTFAEPQGAKPLLGDYVAIEISDSGSGISEEVLGKVFEPFFTTKGIGKGTGLGLSQIHGFIQQSGGDIAIASEVGKGTTVTLYLPRSKEMPSPAQISMQPAPSFRLQKKDVVLVVDDDDAVRQTIVEQLYDLGYRPIAVRSPEEARGILGADGRVDILLTDYTLAGGSNGMELARQAKKQRPELRTIIMTASFDVEKLSGTLLRKPFAQAELEHTLAGATR
jgi:two-component system, NtrC family, sensor kinase